MGLSADLQHAPADPRRLEAFGVPIETERVRVMPAMGFFDFVKLERHARCVLCDSGTVQEECCIFGVPAVTVRDTTERPETVECGSNVLSGVDPQSIRRCTAMVLERQNRWDPPPEYLAADVSNIVAKIVLGHHENPVLGRFATAPSATPAI